MANNRLWITHPASEDKIILAKSFGSGWEVCCTTEQLQNFLADIDASASFGNASEMGPTQLRIVAENDE